MIVASAAALLATSDPDQLEVYRFETSSDGPRTTLTASVPRARYLVRARVIALGPANSDSTESALATVHGSIAPSANANTTGDGGSPSVRASFGTKTSTGSATQSDDAVSALHGFLLSHPPRFSGNCSEPDHGAPCQAELELDLGLEAPSALPVDASIDIDWTVHFESRVFKKGGDADELIAAPWTIEIVELNAP